MDAGELVTEILTIVNTLSSVEVASLSLDTLSRLAVKLASYKASLGEPLADAHRVMLDAEAQYYEARASEYGRLRDEGRGSTDAGELKHLHHDALDAWNDAKVRHSKLKQLSVDCHDLIEVIRGRLISLNSEQRESNV